MKPQTNAWILALVPVTISVWMAADILLGATGDDPTFAYLQLGNIGLGTLIALSTRFRPRGMVWALAALTGGQITVAAVTVVMRIGTAAVVVAVNGIIAALFAASAWMFRRVAAED